MLASRPPGRRPPRRPARFANSTQRGRCSTRGAVRFFASVAQLTGPQMTCKGVSGGAPQSKGGGSGAGLPGIFTKQGRGTQKIQNDMRFFRVVPVFGVGQPVVVLRIKSFFKKLKAANQGGVRACTFLNRHFWRFSHFASKNAFFHFESKNALISRDRPHRARRPKKRPHASYLLQLLRASAPKKPILRIFSKAFNS